MNNLIFLVDDQPDIPNLIVELLSNENFNFLYLNSGSKVLEMLKEMTPDLIISDVNMPEMDGLELCKIIKANNEWKYIPIIMLTGLNTKEDLALCLAAGADDFITRPFDSVELKARIQSMLRIREQYEQLRQKAEEISEKIFRIKFEDLGEREKKIAHHLAERTPISKNVVKDISEHLTFGQRMADNVANFGGSWVFISIFAVIMLIWVFMNSFLLVRIHETFDPYPYILLNLFLSMLAAIQAPIILMSQNRHSAKDRLSAEHDYEVNLKSELEIMALHEKMDLLREKQWNELISIQQEQLSILLQLIEELKKNK